MAIALSLSRLASTELRTLMRRRLAGFERKIDIAQNVEGAGGVGDRLEQMLDRNN